MKTIFHFGRPYKRLDALASDVVGSGARAKQIPVVGTPFFEGNGYRLVSPCYGPAMVIDAMNFLSWTKGDVVLFVGSMGALAQAGKPDVPVINGITQGMVYIPSEVFPGYQSAALKQARTMVDIANCQSPLVPDAEITDVVRRVVQERRVAFREGSHGCAIAVTDPNTDMQRYRYGPFETVGSLDLESYAGLFCARQKGVRAGLVLYCIDHPGRKLHDFSQEEFFSFEQEMDVKMTRIAHDVLRRIE